jgi:hypothetical protein
MLFSWKTNLDSQLAIKPAKSDNSAVYANCNFTRKINEGQVLFFLDLISLQFSVVEDGFPQVE